MTAQSTRRQFLQSTAAAGVLSAGAAAAHAHVQADAETDDFDEFSYFSRYYPSYGGPEDSDTYMGKLVPGLRPTGLPPVPVIQPDIPRMAWTWEDGMKVFRLFVEPVRRELYPGRWIDLYGVNGSVPGEFIEVTLGDTTRMVLHNHLADPITLHWHGAELPVDLDGVPGVTTRPILPGETFVYTWRWKTAGTFFYHAHIALPEIMGLAGYIIVQPRVAWDPPVDRDFLLLTQSFALLPANTVANNYRRHETTDTRFFPWNWQTINGRVGPYTTPLVCKLGERIRVRIVNYTPLAPRSFRFNGYPYWITGNEGAHEPFSSWKLRGSTKVGIAQSWDWEFIANNPGDWLMHDEIMQHKLNHSQPPMGPRSRAGDDISRYKANLEDRPPAHLNDDLYDRPGYPRNLYQINWTPEQLAKLNAKRELRGIRPNWYMGVDGCSTMIRVLPDDLYDLVMNSDEPVAPGFVSEEIVRRRPLYERMYLEELAAARNKAQSSR